MVNYVEKDDFEKLEERVRRLELNNITLTEQIGTLVKKVDSLLSGINKLLWGIGMVIVVAVVNFIIQGGLS